MTFVRWIRFGILLLSFFLIGLYARIGDAQAVTVVSQLANWDTAPNGTVHVGDDFDPQLDSTLTCTGCWFGQPQNASFTTPNVTYGRTTAHGVTQGTGALDTMLYGHVVGGGTYSVNINGVPVTLQTHFTTPLSAVYSNTTNAAAGGPDPRYAAINTAATSAQVGLYSISFDVTYDIAELRSIAWQPAIETVNPGANNENKYPQRFFWIGMAVNGNNFASTGGGVDAQANINPFDAQWDSNLFPTFHVSYPLTDFGAALTVAAPSSYTFEILYNSVFGTTPLTSNTNGAHLMFDNLQLVKLNPAASIDYNNNGSADPGDWTLFMAHYLQSNPAAPVANPSISFDLVGAFGAATLNNLVDFDDLQKFQSLYKLANPGPGAGAMPWASGTVPEPGTFVLSALALLGLVASRGRRVARAGLALLIAVLVCASQQAAQAQLLESWETLGKWGVIPSADPNGAPYTVALSTTPGTVTNGTQSLKVTQGTGTVSVFTWVAASTPTNFVAGDTFFDQLAHAVRLGAENYNLLVDTTFDPPNDLGGVQTLQVTFGLNFNGQNAGLFDGSTSPTTKFTTTTTIPLSSFNLPDTVDQGVNNYSAQIGLTGTNALGGGWAAYVDNVRLQQVTVPNTLTLEVNQGTGAATLKNTSPGAVSFNYLDIKSAGASLNAAGFTGGADPNFVVAGGDSATELAEAALTGSRTMNPGDTLSLGNLFSPGVNAHDLSLVIRKSDGAANRTYDQVVTYVGTAPAGIPGDYNKDGIVNTADYTVWRDHLNQTTAGGYTLPNEGASTGTVDNADYTFWKNNFGAHGSGSGALGSGAVPEPSTLMMGLCGIVGILAARRKKFA